MNKRIDTTTSNEMREKELSLYAENTRVETEVKKIE